MNDTRKTSTSYAAVYADGTPASPEYLDLASATVRANDIGAGYVRTTSTVITEATNPVRRSTLIKRK